MGCAIDHDAVLALVSQWFRYRYKATRRRLMVEKFNGRTIEVTRGRGSEWWDGHITTEVDESSGLYIWTGTRWRATPNAATVACDGDTVTVTVPAPTVERLGTFEELYPSS